MKEKTQDSRGNAQALRTARQRDSAEKRARTADAIQTLIQTGHAVSVAAVATAANVSRQFVYSHEDLLLAVESAMRSQRQNRVAAQRQPRNTSVALESIKSDLLIAQEEIKRLRAENSEMREALRLQLGAELESQDERRAADLLADKARQVERLTNEVEDLRARTERQERQIADLQEELTAERRADAYVRGQGNVTPLHANPRIDAAPRTGRKAKEKE